METSNWWENNLNAESGWAELEGWLETSEIKSREYIFDFIEKNNIKDVLEIGPGVFIDHRLFFSRNTDISYKCADITTQIVDRGKNMGIESYHCDIQKTELDDSNFELVYCRHVFEHLPEFNKALEEMLRIAKKYVIVVFWMLNDDTEEENIISYDERLGLYHNKYSKKKIYSYLDALGVSYIMENKGNDIVLTISK